MDKIISIFTIMKSFFYSFIIEPFEGLTDRIKNFKSAPLKTIIQIIIVSITIFISAVFLIAFILFIVGGGYGTQINAAKENFGQMFTSGTLPLYYNYVSGFCGIMFPLALIIMYVSCIANSTGKKKKVFIVLTLIDLVIVIALFVTGIFIFTRTRDLTNLNEAAEIYDFISNNYFTTVIYVHFLQNIASNMKTVIIALISVSVVTIVCFIASLIMMLKSEIGYLFKKWLIALNAAFIVMPLILWFIENIIAFIIFIIIVIVILIVIGIFTAIIGNTEAVSGRGSPVTDKTTKSTPLKNNVVNNKINERTTPKPKEKIIRVKEVESDVKLKRAEDFSGYKHIQGDRGYGTFKVCSQEEFDTGKVVIKKGGKKVERID